MSPAAAIHHRAIAVALASLIALIAPACGSDDEAAVPATAAATTGPPTTATPTTVAPTAAPPTTAAPTTAAPTTAAPTTTVVQVEAMTAGDASVELHTGETVRFQTEAGAFELAGQDGWFAFVTPLSLWVANFSEIGRAWVSIVHLKDAHPELGLEGADLTGAAIAADPRAAAADLRLPDGTPIVENFRPLPDDWFAYLATLPGLTIGDPAPSTLGEISGVAADYDVDGVAVVASANCPTGLITWVEVNGYWCFEEGEAGTVMIVEADGARYELNVGANDRATPADAAALEAITASLRLL